MCVTRPPPPPPKRGSELCLAVYYLSSAMLLFLCNAQCEYHRTNCLMQAAHFVVVHSEYR